MVGLATRASNNHINRSVFWGKGNINSLVLQYREICRWRGTELTQVLQERFRNIDGSTVFWRQALRVTRLEVPTIYFIISPHQQKMRHSCVEGGFVLVVIGRCTLVARFRVGGGRSQAQAEEREEGRRLDWNRGNTIFTSSAKMKAELPRAAGRAFIYNRKSNVLNIDLIYNTHSLFFHCVKIQYYQKIQAYAVFKMVPSSSKNQITQEWKALQIIALK